MHSLLQETIQARRKVLVDYLAPIMQQVADEIVVLWGDQEKLSRHLSRHLQPWATLSFCERLYTITPQAEPYGSVSTQNAEVPSEQQRYEVLAPYLGKARSKGFQLTQVYISTKLHRSCISAIQPIADSGEVVGYLVGDFDLRRLPQDEDAICPEYTWRQIKGDPAIRRQLFAQRFVPRAIDEYYEDVINILDELVVERGIFRISIRFPSSSATLWVEEDPYDEHTHVLGEILDPSICLVYPKRPYPQRAKVMTDMVRPILKRFGELRRADDVVYLRNGSLNIISGLVETNFSCDGTHLMPAEMFLEKDEAFWFGTTKQQGSVCGTSTSESG